MIGGGSDIEKAAAESGMPVAFLKECEEFKYNDGTVYPDNVLPVSVFADMRNQWRVGVNGATGLDFGALQAVPIVRRIKDDDEYDDIFECLRIMESAALEEMRSKS